MIHEAAKPQQPSLRERKRQQTRVALIDAAVELCLKRGYEGTTVEQIAESADVSPRTFSRYFASKDAVFIAVLEDLAVEITAAIKRQPRNIGPMEALRLAHVDVFTRASRAPLSRLSAERVAVMLRVVNGSSTLRQAAVDYRSSSAVLALAEQMGVPADDPQLELAVALFSTTLVQSCSDLIDDVGEIRLGPDIILERLDYNLRHVVKFATEMQVAKLQQG